MMKCLLQGIYLETLQVIVFCGKASTKETIKPFRLLGGTPITIFCKKKKYIMPSVSTFELSGYDETDFRSVFRVTERTPRKLVPCRF